MLPCAPQLYRNPDQTK